MVEQQESALTPEEAGAFVAQWVDTHRVTLPELAQRFEVESAEALSLARQAKGRLNMEAWLRDQQPAKRIPASFWLLVAAALVAGGLIGCLIMQQLSPSPGSESPAPMVTNVQVSSDSSPSSASGVSFQTASPRVVPLKHGSGVAVHKKPGFLPTMAPPIHGFKPRSGRAVSIRPLMPKSAKPQSF